MKRIIKKIISKILHLLENALHLLENAKYKSTLQYISDSFPAYHHGIILELHKKYSLSGKVILDVGGSNIPVALMRDLGVKQFICIDPITKYLSFHNFSTVSEYLGKKVYSKDDIHSSLPDEYCYIIDTDVEEANDIFLNYFDIIISISTFEHLSNIRKSLEIMHKFLRTGGILHSQYEPIFSCPVGHHMYIDKDINFTNNHLSILDNIHLLYTKDEAKELIKNNFNDDIINTILYQIYDSPIINRKTFNQHILEIMNSPFNNYSITYYWRSHHDSLILKKLIEKIGFMRFDVRGLRLQCVKD
jgi:SAM-dependent methyltransferase